MGTSDLRTSIKLVLLLTAACVCLQGCSSSSTRTSASSPATASEWKEAWQEGLPGASGGTGGGGRRVRLGRSENGRPIRATVFEGGEGCVLIIGGIHGDEASSTAVVEHLIRRLRRNPEDRAAKTVVCIPRMNPDGLAAGTRANADGVDLNRNFMASNFREGGGHGPSALSEPESQTLAAAISRFRPSCIVSVHADLDCIDPDGGRDSRRLARRMTTFSPLPFEDLEAKPGSLGSYAGNTLGLKMITYELSHKQPRHVNPSEHMRALLLAIREG
jgi:hypothetical protein